MNTLAELADVFAFLDELRYSGITNMWGAGAYVADAYGLSGPEGRRLAGLWMETYDRDKSPKDRADEALHQGRQARL